MTHLKPSNISSMRGYSCLAFLSAAVTSGCSTIVLNLGRTADIFVLFYPAFVKMNFAHSISSLETGADLATNMASYGIGSPICAISQI